MIQQPYSGVRRMVCYERGTLEAAGRAREATVWNLSVLGAYVSVDPIPQVGEHVRIVFQLPPSGPLLQARAEVAWRNTVQNPRCLALPYGCGLHFLGLAAADRDRIGALVEAAAKVG